MYWEKGRWDEGGEEQRGEEREGGKGWAKQRDVTRAGGMRSDGKQLG